MMIRNKFALSLMFLFVLYRLALGGTEEDLAFYVPFEKGIDADSAAGDPKGTWGGGEGAKFVEGIVGKGLYTGEASQRQCVTYQVDKNLIREKGTITFWCKGIKDRWDMWRYRGPTSTFLAFNGTDGWCLFYKWNYGGLWLLSEITEDSKKVNYNLDLPELDQFQWHFFAIGWDGDRVRLYLDGNPAKSVDDYHLPNFTGTFTFGQDGGEEPTERILDELKIYRRLLTPSEVRQVYRRESQFLTEPLVTIPASGKPITIDGKITEGEWGSAATITGLLERDSGERASTQSKFRLTYDKDFLYVAVDSEIPASAKERVEQELLYGLLKRARTKHDEDVDSDDAIEVTIVPDWAKDRAADWFRFVVNGIDTHYEFSISKEGNINLHWNPEWESASTVDFEGWHLEMRIPFSAFEGTPAPGEVWGMNFVRIWRLLKDEFDGWAWGKRIPGTAEIVPSRWNPLLPEAAVRFGGEETLLVQVEKTGRLEAGSVDFLANLKSNFKEEREFLVTLKTDSEEVNVSKTLKLAPGGEERFAFSGSLANFSSSVLTFELADAKDKVVYHRTVVPFFMKQCLSISTKHYPTAGLLQVEMEVAALADVPLSEIKGEVAIRKKGVEGPVLSVKEIPFEDYRKTADLSTEKLEEGEYEIEAAVFARKIEVARTTLPFIKASLPEWYGNKIGISDKVMTPFTPISFDEAAEKIGVWGRTYEYSSGFLPKQVTTQGSNILSGPVRFILTDSDGIEHSSLEGEVSSRWLKVTEGRIEFEKKMALGGVNVESTNWLEYDGFLWNTLRLTPGSVSAIKGLRLEIPFAKEWAELINAYDYSAMTSGFLPPDGYHARLTPAGPANGTGGGMQFLAETSATWNVADRNFEIEVVPHEDHVLMRVNFVNLETDLAKEPLELSFGLNATPVRPKTPGYRQWNTLDGDVMLGYSWHWARHFVPFRPEYAGMGFWWQPSEEERKSGKHLFRASSSGPYVSSAGFNPEMPEYRYWGDEWSNNPNFRYVRNPAMRKEEAVIYVCQGASSWRDYLLWSYDQLYKTSKTGFRGLYFDDGPATCTNTRHGCGVIRGGSIHPTQAFLAYRELAKRLYTFLREKYDQTYIIHHHSGMINTAFWAFRDVYADGENFTSQLTVKEPSYHQHYRVDSFKAQSMGHNFGPPVWFLDEFTRSGAMKYVVDRETGKVVENDFEKLAYQPVEYLFGLILLHDSTYWQAYASPESYEPTRQALRNYGWGEAYRYIPYWEQKIVNLPRKGMYASIFLDEKDMRALIVFLNNTEEGGEISLEVDWKALGLGSPEGLNVENAAHTYLGQEKNWARIEGERLTFSYSPQNYRLIAIEKR